MSSDVWSENAALFERLMKIHSNPPILYYGFNSGAQDISNWGLWRECVLTKLKPLSMFSTLLFPILHNFEIMESVIIAWVFWPYGTLDSNVIDLLIGRVGEGVGKTLPSTVYAIYVAYRYFRDFGLGGDIHDGLFHDFCGVFITINNHILNLVEIFLSTDSRNSRK